MTTEYILKDSNGLNAHVDGVQWVLLPGYTLSDQRNPGNAFDFLTTSNGQFIVEGSVYSYHGDGIASGFGSIGNTVYVSGSGIVEGFQAAIQMWGQAHKVTNMGEVRGGIVLIGDDGEIINGGVVDEIAVTGSHGEVTNLQGGDVGRVVIEGEANSFFNEGEESSFGNIDNRYSGFVDDVLVAGTDNVLSNNGRITGQVEFATVEGESNSLLNSGTIGNGEDPGVSVVGGSGDEVIINNYSIYGDVLLYGGNDTYDGRNGYLRDEYYYDEYNERVKLYIDPGTVDGGLGDDDLTGTQDNDTLLGGGGADVIRGAKGSDYIAGGSGYDTLIGGVWDDVLEGNGGQDRLEGRAGSDRLIGGKGADTFVFGKDYYVSTWNDRDRIVDFEEGIDKIDLSAFGVDFAAVEGAIMVDREDITFIDLAELGGEGIVFLNNIAPEQLDASDFIL